MTLLDRYLAAHFARAAGFALVLLLALFSFLALTDALDDVGKGSFTSVDAVAVVLLTLPARCIDLLPVTALLGSALGLGSLATHHELTAIRAAGVSMSHLARTLGVIAGFLVILAALLQFAVVPPAERKAQAFHARTLDQTARGGTEFWSRHEGQVIRVGAVAFGQLPRDIEIYEIDAENHLVHLLRASRADIVDAHTWTLHDVDERIIAGETVSGRHLDSQAWASFLSPDQLSTLVSPAHALSPLDLWRYLRETRDSGLDTRDHEVRFWHQVSLPLTLSAMTLLGLPMVAGSVRTRSGGLRAVLGGVIGIAFYLFERITGQLALLFDLDPAITALLPPCLLLVVAIIGIRRIR